MKQSIIMLALVFLLQDINAQGTACTVLIDSLKGSYEGECSSGKANGFGKAKGVDYYEGNFKSGLPDGKGKYTWKNGDYYDGNWKKGIKEGKGELHRTINKKDSVTIGFWKKDNYKGEYEFPYVIRNVTSEIGRVQVSKVSDKGKAVTITVENLQSGGSFQQGVSMTSHQITGGSYISKSSNALSNKEVTNFRGVIFPFRGTFNFGSSIFEIEIFEEGSWDITVPINK